MIKSSNTDTPFPWEISRADYDNVRTEIISCGEQAQEAFPWDVFEYRALNLRKEILTEKSNKLSKQLFDAPPSLGSARIKVSLDKTVADLAITTERLNTSNAVSRRRWDARQVAMLSLAKSKYPHWLECGAFIEHPPRPGEPVVTICDHKDVVSLAIKGGLDVPDCALADYPWLVEKLDTQRERERA